MKVLQITSHYNQGGAARIAAYIHQQLLRDGVESKVAYGRGKSVAIPGVEKFDKEHEIYVSAFLSRFLGINGWWNIRGTKRLLRIIKEFEPDIIHIHALHGYYLNFPRLWNYINEQETSVVWTFHDCHAFVGNCGYFFECEKWRSGCGKCPHKKDYPTSQWFDFTGWMWKKKKEMFTRGTNKVIVSPSDWMTSAAKESFFGKYPCVTIRNGIDTVNMFYPRDKAAMRYKYGFGETEKLVLGIAVGYKDPRKGAKHIVRMASDLRDDVKVILIGWDNSCDDMLQGLDNVITLPATSSAEMLAEYYSLADVFVLPSLAENYATTNLEAMACGTPVVGFAAGGTREQLANGRGIAVPVGDQERFTAAVRTVLEETKAVLRGAELAEKISEENSVRKMTEQYINIYKKLLDNEHIESEII